MFAISVGANVLVNLNYLIPSVKHSVLNCIYIYILKRICFIRHEAKIC